MAFSSNNIDSSIIRHGGREVCGDDDVGCGGLHFAYPTVYRSDSQRRCDVRRQFWELHRRALEAGPPPLVIPE